MKKLNLFLLLWLISLKCVVAQSIIQNPAIDLAVPYQTIQALGLSWNTPAGARSCNVRHQYPGFDTTYIIPNFTLDTAQIPASFPSNQPYEKLTISFRMSNGDTEYDETFINGLVYGGIVYVEDDVFYGPLGGPCVLNSENIEFVVFMHNCRATTLTKACEISDNYFTLNNIPPPPYPYHGFDSLAYATDLLTTVDNLYNNGDPDVWLCDDFLEGDFRKAKTAYTQNKLISYPNPVKDQLIVQVPELASTRIQTLTIKNLVGKVVFQEAINTQSTPNSIKILTEKWVNGIYFAQFSDGTNTYVTRVVKR